MFSNSFSRTDRSILGQWWWTVDRWLFSALILLLCVGIFLSFAASPVVAQRLELDSFFFVRRHLALAIPVVTLMVLTSLIQPRFIRFLCWILFALCIIFLMLTPFIGIEIKGARRWVNIFGFSLQASEFIKPTFAVITAWLLSQKNFSGTLSGKMLSIILYFAVVFLILLQPDFGMVFVISSVWFLQFFVAGIPLFWVYLLGGTGVAGVIGAYFVFPHIASRIDRFLNPETGDQYQITKSLEAFKNGGWLGRGPGEGIVKRGLPDAHADFVFSVAGEEFGLILCLFILGLFIFIAGRGLYLARKEHNFFLTLAISGLIFQFTLQAIINISSSLHLIPTKGMTLPFLSYGGSSLIAIGLGMGMVLSFTRRRLDDKGI